MVRRKEGVDDPKMTERQNKPSANLEKPSEVRVNRETGEVVVDVCSQRTNGRRNFPPSSIV
jgi:hypothetical protein